MKEIKSTDLESVEFTEQGGLAGNEATKTTWRSTDTVRRMLLKEEHFRSWGIRLRVLQEIGYPEPLLHIDSGKNRPDPRPVPGCNSKSILQGARSKTPEKGDYLNQNAEIQRRKIIFDNQD